MGVIHVDEIANVFERHNFVAPITVKTELSSDNWETVRYIHGEYNIQMVFEHGSLAQPINVKTDPDLCDSISGDMHFDLDESNGRVYKLDDSRIYLPSYVVNELFSLNSTKNSIEHDINFIALLLTHFACQKYVKFDETVPSMNRKVLDLIGFFFEQRVKEDKHRHAQFKLLLKLAWTKAAKTFKLVPNSLNK